MPIAEERNIPADIVKKDLSLNCSRQHAFDVFTRSMGRWWPATHHVGAVPFRDVVIEPRTGGRWYELSAQDQEGLWGHVLLWQPPHRLVLSWHLDVQFAFNPDLARASEIHLTFHELGVDRARVEFEHRHIERHGEGFQKLRDLLDGGWVGILDEFAKLAVPMSSSGAGAQRRT